MCLSACVYVQVYGKHLCVASCVFGQVYGHLRGIAWIADLKEGEGAFKVTLRTIIHDNMFLNDRKHWYRNWKIRAKNMFMKKAWHRWTYFGANKQLKFSAQTQKQHNSEGGKQDSLSCWTCHSLWQNTGKRLPRSQVRKPPAVVSSSTSVGASVMTICGDSSDKYGYVEHEIRVGWMSGAGCYSSNKSK